MQRSITATELQNKYQEGLELYKQKKFNEALAIFDDFLQIKENDIVDKSLKLNACNYYHAYYYRAYAILCLNRKEEAQVAFKKLVEVAPDNYDAWRLYANGLFSLNQYHECLEACEKSLSLKEYPPAIQLKNIVMKILKKEQKQEADREPAQILTLESSAPIETPSDAELFKNSGYDKLDSGDNAGAIVDFTEALRLKPNNEEIFLAQSIAKCRLGNYKSAIEDCDAIIRINPHNLYAYIDRAWAKLVLGNHKDALADYNTALDLNETLDLDYSLSAHVCALEGRAILYRITGEVEKANADEQKAKSLGLEKQDDPSYIMFASKEYLDCATREMKKENGNLKAALIYCDEAIRLQPNHPDAVHFRTQIINMNNEAVLSYLSTDRSKILRGDYTDAIEDFNSVIRLNPNGDYLYSAFANRGLAHSFLGNNEYALEDFDQALRLRPNDPEILKERAKLYRILTLNENAECDVQPARQHEKEEKQEINNGEQTKIVTLESSNPIESASDTDLSKVLANRGIAQCALGNHREALNDFDDALWLSSTHDTPIYIYHYQAILYRIIGHDYAQSDAEQARNNEEKKFTDSMKKDFSETCLAYAALELERDKPNLKAALIYYDEALRLQPNDPKAIQCRTQFLCHMNEQATSLYQAAADGRVNCINALIKAKADVDQPCSNGARPIQAAMENMQVEAIVALLKAGARDTLSEAEAKNSILVPSKIYPSVDKEYSGSPLYWAAAYGNIASMPALIKNGAAENINQKDEWGRTPVYMAAALGYADAIPLLKAAGGSMDLSDNQGRTPIFVAAGCGHTETITALKTAGATTIDTPNIQGITPLCVAAMFGHAEAFRALNKASATTMDTPDGIGEKEVVTALLNAEADAGREHAPNKEEKHSKQFSSPKNIQSLTPNTEDKKIEPEKIQNVLEELRTIFLEQRDEGEKTERYDIYNKYLKEAHPKAQLVYKQRDKKHVLYMNGKPLTNSDAAAEEISKMLDSLILENLLQPVLSPITQSDSKKEMPQDELQALKVRYISLSSQVEAITANLQTKLKQEETAKVSAQSEILRVQRELDALTKEKQEEKKPQATQSTSLKILMSLPTANYESPSSEHFTNLMEYKRAHRFKQQVMDPNIAAARIKLQKEGKLDNTKPDAYTIDAPERDRIYREARNPCGGPPNKSTQPYAPPTNTYRFGVKAPAHKNHLFEKGHNVYHITANWQCLASILNGDFDSDPPPMNRLTNAKHGIYVSPSFQMWKLFQDLPCNCLWVLWNDKETNITYECALIIEGNVSPEPNACERGPCPDPQFSPYLSSDWPNVQTVEGLVKNARDDLVIAGIHVWMNPVGNGTVEPMPCEILESRVGPRLDSRADERLLASMIKQREEYSRMLLSLLENYFSSKPISEQVVSYLPRP